MDEPAEETREPLPLSLPPRLLPIFGDESDETSGRAEL
jgi:hypothetical protein